MHYNHQEVEKKWQKQWADSGVFHAEDFSKKPKFYCLIEFPYPSGAGLHIGHPRSYTALDVVARKRRMEGFNVLYPIGWDAFGLPTENYAIKHGRKPQDVTKEHIATFKRQLQSLGLSFDWSREVNTTDPEYYKWTQWMFLEFFKAGLAYKTNMPINWCLSCKIGLANEEVVNGTCERCGGPTEKRDKAQWMIAITQYADRLLKDLDSVDYLEKIKTQQRNWIGRSEGVNITYPVDRLETTITVFTTRPDTNFGATFLVVAPDSEFVQKNFESFSDKVAAKMYRDTALKKTNEERLADGRKKSGVATGLFAINHFTQKKMPIYMSDFVIGTFGTGAVVGVPGHDVRDFEFAQAHGIDIVRVVVGPDGDVSPIKNVEQVQEKEGVMIHSDFLNGLDIHRATQVISDYLIEHGWGTREVNYKLRDWVFSRQRYWGEPIPLISCETCGWVPVSNEQLPVTLPDVEKFEPTDSGESPLAMMTDWVNTLCPTCGGSAKRETDTMPNWAGSSWYFLAYAMHTELNAQPADQLPTANYQLLQHWMPVDWYNGGMEHTTLHLLYSRFSNKFLFDRGHVPTSEPYTKRTSHGLILAEDGTKMSKSKGNVVNPDEMVELYGADAVRLFELFMGPFAEPVPWNVNGLIGMRRFLEKVIDVHATVQDTDQQETHEHLRSLHKTIKKVTEDIEAMRFNTAVSALMIFINDVKDSTPLHKETFQIFLHLLSPFAPHLANELSSQLGESSLLESQSWPLYDPAFVKDDLVSIAVQVNGKLRTTIQASPDADQQSVLSLAYQDEHVQKQLNGKEPKRIVYVQGRMLNLVL